MGCASSKEATADNRRDKVAAGAGLQGNILPSGFDAPSSLPWTKHQPSQQECDYVPGPPLPKTSQPPFTESQYSFLEDHNLSGLGVLLLLSSLPEAVLLRDILATSTSTVQLVQASLNGRPWTLQLSSLCLDMLHQLQQLKEPQLPSLKGPILRLKAAVDDLGRCCAEWTKPGWLWELAAGRLDISDFLAVHKLVLEVISDMGLDMGWHSKDLGNSMYTICIARLVESVRAQGLDDMHLGRLRLLNGPVLSKEASFPMEAISSGLENNQMIASACEAAYASLAAAPGEPFAVPRKAAAPSADIRGDEISLNTTAEFSLLHDPRGAAASHLTGGLLDASLAGGKQQQGTGSMPEAEHTNSSVDTPQAPDGCRDISMLLETSLHDEGAQPSGPSSVSTTTSNTRGLRLLQETAHQRVRSHRLPSRSMEAGETGPLVSSSSKSLCSTIEPGRSNKGKPLLGVPDLPDGYVIRRKLLKQACATMVTMKRLVLEGEGFRTGLGCSSLAAAVVRTTEAAELCTDGVVWLSLGLWRGSGALEEIRILRETVRLLEAKIPEAALDSRGAPHDGDMVEQATGRISALLSGKAFLLVLDSYEPRPALEKLEALHWHCKILTIFRPEDTGGAGSPDPAAVAVPPFDTETAREFMRAKGLATDQGLHEAILSIGCTPLALAILRSVLVNQPCTDTLEQMLEEFQSTPVSQGAKDPGLARAIGWVQKQLPEVQRKALRQLAILPKSAARALPESVLCELWQLSTGETEDLVATMESLGICRGLENAIGAPSIAIPWEFILEQEAAESASQLRAWHEELARRLLMSPPAIRHSTASAFSLDDYMGENLARHMVGGALATELRGLLCDFDWLEAMLIAHGAEATRSAWERYLVAEPGDTSAPLWYEAFCSSAETFGQNPAGGSLRFLMNERMSGQAIQKQKPALSDYLPALSPDTPQQSLKIRSTLSPPPDAAPQKKDQVLPQGTDPPPAGARQDGEEHHMHGGLELVSPGRHPDGDGNCTQALQVTAPDTDGEEEHRLWPRSLAFGGDSLLAPKSPRSGGTHAKARLMRSDTSTTSPRSNAESLGQAGDTSFDVSDISTELPPCQSSSSPRQGGSSLPNTASPQVNRGMQDQLAPAVPSMPSLGGQPEHQLRTEMSDAVKLPLPRRDAEAAEPWPGGASQAPCGNPARQSQHAGLAHFETVHSSPRQSVDDVLMPLPSAAIQASLSWAGVTPMPMAASRQGTGLAFPRVEAAFRPSAGASASVRQVATQPVRTATSAEFPAPSAGHTIERLPADVDTPCGRKEQRGDGEIEQLAHQSGPESSVCTPRNDDVVHHILTPRMKEEPGGGGIQGIVVDTDGRYLVRVGNDNGRTSLNFRAGLLEKGKANKPAGRAGMYTSALTSAGDRAVVVDSDGKQSVWDLNSGQILHEIDAEAPEDGSVSISSGLSTVVLPKGGGGDIKVLDMKTGECKREIACPPGQKMQSVAVSVDGQRLIATSDSKQALVCDLNRNLILRINAPNRDEISGIASTSDGTRLVTVSSEGIARVWDVEKQTCLYQLEGSSPWSGGITVHEDHRTAVAVSASGAAELWDLQKNECIQKLNSSTERIRGVAITSDGRNAVTVADDGRARVTRLAQHP